MEWTPEIELAITNRIELRWIPDCDNTASATGFLNSTRELTPRHGTFVQKCKVILTQDMALCLSRNT